MNFIEIWKFVFFITERQVKHKILDVYEIVGTFKNCFLWEILDLAASISQIQIIFLDDRIVFNKINI